MINSSTERGLSEVLGAILMFALVFSLLVIVQVWAVPTANAQIELQHSENVEADYGQLAATLDRVSSLGVSETVSLDAGVRYPSRIFLINPPPASYTFSSTDGQRISLSGVDADDEEAADFLNAVDDPMNFATVSYTYRADYNLYREAPSFHVENGLVYKQFPNGEVVLVSEPDIIDGRRISLTVFDGVFSQGGTDTLELDVTPVSAGREYTSVVATGTPELRFYSGLSEAVWNDLLIVEGNEPNVLSVSCTNASAAVDEPCNDDIVVTLKSGVTYDLRVSKLAIGQAATPTDTPTYVTKVGSLHPTIVPGGNEITVKVHDEYNNALSNQRVDFQLVEGDGSLSRTYDTTDRNGLVSVEYTPVGNAPVTIAAGLDTNGDGKVDDEITRRYVQYTDLTVGQGNLDEGPQVDINSAQPGSVVLMSSTITPENCNGNSQDCDAVLRFKNTGTEAQTIEAMRINYYSPNAISRGSGAFPGIPTTVEISGSTGTKEIPVQGAFADATIATFDGGETEELTFAFQKNGAHFDLYEGDFFMFTLIYTDGGSNIYIAAPTNSNTPPTASFTGPTEVSAGAIASFDASASTDDGTIEKYRWQFGDGVSLVTNTPTVQHTYTSTTDTTYTVTLTVEDNEGGQDQATRDVDVTATTSGDNDPTISQFTVTDNSVTSGNSQKAEFVVDWSVTDADSDLDTVTVTVRNLDTSTDTPYSGSSGSVTHTAPGEQRDNFRISVVATDLAGNTDSRIVEDTADGS